MTRRLGRRSEPAPVGPIAALEDQISKRFRALFLEHGKPDPDEMFRIASADAELHRLWQQHQFLIDAVEDDIGDAAGSA